MAVITISRGSFSGGKRLAECAAGKLGYRCIDRDVIVRKAAAYGVSEEEVRNALEKPPTFWDRFKHTKYVYLALIQAALTEEVSPGKAIYHGHAGHLLLHGVGHVMRTRIIAPMAIRVKAVQERLNVGEDAAMSYIQRMDQDRLRWAQYLYGVDWGNPAFYDLVLNLEHLDVCQACEIIAAMARLESFRETDESRAAMQDLTLASRVRANLALAPETKGLEVDVTARAGAITVSGEPVGRDRLPDIEAVVRRVPGVSDLSIEVPAEVQA